MLSDAVFAYGTLMSGQPRHYLLLRAAITSIEPAHVSGTLLHLGEYPALVLTPDAETPVCGELITLQKLGEQQLRELDEEEGWEYRRQRVNVQSDSGTEVPCWTYVFTGDPTDYPVIASGDWRRELNFDSSKDVRSR